MGLVICNDFGGIPEQRGLKFVPLRTVLLKENENKLKVILEFVNIL
jgi:hypothetical protein